MAEEMRGNVLRLEEHCRRRVNQHLEALLGEQDPDEETTIRAQAAAQAIDQELYRHLDEVLELWQRPPARLQGEAG